MTRFTYDYLIVGAGFAGSVLAERLARGSGKRVLLIDKRNHIGGNAYDCHDAAGVLIHKYGPHIFHTNSREVFDYLSQFTQWRQYQHRVLASVDGQLVPIPINLETINRLYGLNLDSKGAAEFFASVAEKRDAIRTSEESVVSKVGQELYKKFFAATRASNGASIRANSMLPSPRECPRAPTAMTAISPTPTRRCRCTASRACSRTCSITRTSKSCSTPTTGRW